MLNLSIAMFRFTLLLTVLFQTSVAITSPQSGAAVRGQVEILGNVDVPNYESAELAFGYLLPEGTASSPAEAWFIIRTFPQPIAESPLAVWDTSSVTDGEYILRLRVYLQDGTIQDAPLVRVIVGSDTPTPTPTATPQEALEPTSVPVVTVQPPPPTSLPTFAFFQPTEPPPNPASLTVPLVYSIFGRGALIALGVFLLFLLLLRLRKN